MNLTKKQTEFWAVLLVFCLVTAILVLLVDFGIKAAILEESNKLRLKIEAWEIANGRINKAATTDGNSPDASNDSAVSVPLLVDESPRLETPNVPNRAEETTNAANGQRPKSRRSTSTRRIPSGDK